MERRARSDRYQQIYLECLVMPERMESFCNEDSIHARLNPWDYNEDIMDLEDQLKIEFWRVVNTMLTERQAEVLKLMSEGLTQCEIAKKLGVNQSSITKSRNGNNSYKENEDIKIYGGSEKKLKKIIEEDAKILEILAKINEIRNNTW